MSDSPNEDTALTRIAELRGDLREGMAEIKGALNVLVTRSEQIDRTQTEQRRRLDRHGDRLDVLDAHRATSEAAHKETADALSGLSDRLAQVEKRVWTAVGGLAVISFGIEIVVNLMK